MIKCYEKDKDAILKYIDKDYGKCAYLYIDLLKYGFDNENVDVWRQEDSDGNYVLIALQYYTGMHVFSRENKFDADDLATLIIERSPALVCGMEDTIGKVRKQIPHYLYEDEIGIVVRLEEYSGIADDSAYICGRDELEEVAELLSTDPELGGPYSFELLHRQLLERYDDNFGRCWIRRDESGIISNSATYAENEKLAVISGAIVREDHRGKGEFAGQLGATCRDLYREGKEVISYLYDERAKKTNYKVGFRVLGEWMKLIKK